jgi:hypothetical protein
MHPPNQISPENQHSSQKKGKMRETSPLGIALRPTRQSFRLTRQVFLLVGYLRFLKEDSRFFWFFVAAQELVFLLHNRFEYRHNNLMRALLIEAYKKGF